MKLNKAQKASDELKANTTKSILKKCFATNGRRRNGEEIQKKPVVVEAVHFTGTYRSVKEALEFMGQKVNLETEKAEDMFEKYCHMVWIKGLTIQTLEGDHLARLGDYIVKGVEGEFYPCKPQIFWKTYEEVDD